MHPADHRRRGDRDDRTRSGTCRAAKLTDPGPLAGFLDTVTRELVAGWARSDDTPEEPVNLRVSVNGQDAARVLANAHRRDLEQAGLGSGRYAFAVRLENISPLETCTVRIQRDSDGADVPGSPVILEAASGFDASIQAALARVIANVASDPDLDARATFLAEQLERLIQLRADRHSRRVDRERLRQVKWRWTAEDGAMPVVGRRALVIDDRLPALDRDAGSNAIVSHMGALQRLGYEVNLAPADMVPGAWDAALEAMGFACYRRPWTGSVEEVLRREAGTFDVVYVHRLSNTAYLSMLRTHLPRAWIVFAVADLMSLRLSRQGEVESRPELAQHAARVWAAELGAGRFVNAVLTHSTHEAGLLRAALGAAKVHVVPWEVRLAPVAVPFARRGGLAFVGGYGHPPNVDAVHHLMLDIMPLVWRDAPGLVVHLVGSDLPDGLRAYAGPRVTLAGHVAELSTVFETVRLTVAPLTFGAGVKGKVLDSLAAGVPCVCTPVAAEGLELGGALSGLVAGSPAAFATAILRLHADGGLNAAYATAGLALVRARHSAAVVDAALAHALPPPSE